MRLAQASADVRGDKAEAFSTTNVVVESGVIAEVDAESQASTCAHGVGSKIDVESTLVPIVTVIVAKVFATSNAVVCFDGFTHSAAKARCEACSRVYADY